MTNKHNIQSADASSLRFRLQSTLLRVLKGRGGMLLASALTLGTAMVYSDDAAAASGTCQPFAIFEVLNAPRKFQVLCSSGGAAAWMMFNGNDHLPSGLTEGDTPENNSRAERFQSMVMAAILSGKYIRADLVTDTGSGGMCVGVVQTCLKATTWALSNVAVPTPQ